MTRSDPPLLRKNSDLLSLESKEPLQIRIEESGTRANEILESTSTVNQQSIIVGVLLGVMNTVVTQADNLL